MEWPLVDMMKRFDVPSFGLKLDKKSVLLFFYQAEQKLSE